MYFKDTTIVYLNGQFIKATDASTDLYSQTIHYDYEVFEGICSYNTSSGVKIFKAKEHYERLIRSGSLVGIPVNYTVEDMEAATYEVLRLNGFKDAYIRPLVFCSPNMSLTHAKEVSLVIAAWEWGAY